VRVCLQYDANYVGTVLPKEVTFCNLNNNINDSFLREMCKSYGVVDDVTVFYHPKTRRHLGIGMVMRATSLYCCFAVKLLYLIPSENAFADYDEIWHVGLPCAPVVHLRKLAPDTSVA